MSTTALGTQVVTEAHEALSRATRQVIQALIPTLVVVAGGSLTGINIPAVTDIAAMTAIVSLLRYITGLRLDERAPKWAQILDRAAAAAAGTALGFITADTFDASTEIAWRTTLIASVGAAILAVVMTKADPPVITGQIVGPIIDTRLPAQGEPGQDGDF